MRIEDCKPGQRVQIAGRFLLTQLNSVATVLDTRPAQDGNELYPNGMVQVRLSDQIDWPCREPWIGPEDLGSVSRDAGT